MKTKKNYVSPKCLVEEFVANEYVAVCDPKYKDEWIIQPGFKPVNPNTKFALDLNNDGYISETELNDARTSNNSGSTSDTYYGKYNAKIIQGNGSNKHVLPGDEGWYELLRMQNDQQWICYDPGASIQVRNFS
ncbi:MAG: hypothetical protein MJZ83_01665 [Bacteroidaceae bacterium]|nr:hypothetical protein [Bacteroidaceae bacterium]